MEAEVVAFEFRTPEGLKAGNAFDLRDGTPWQNYERAICDLAFKKGYTYVGKTFMTNKEYEESLKAGE